MNLISDIGAGSSQKIRTYAEENPEQFREDIKFTDSNGMNPLHHACKHGYANVAKAILSVDTSRDIINSADTLKGWTPLIYAIYSQDDGGPEIVTLLLSNKADPNIKDVEGNTALHHAAGYGAGDAIEFLSKHKESSLDVQNNQGETPAHMAIKESQMWAFQILIREGCNVNLSTTDGESLAHYAVISIGNGTQFLRILASKGSNLETKNKNGQTPLGIAKEKKLTRVVGQLKELGVQEEQTELNKKAKTLEPTVQQVPAQVKSDNKSLKANSKMIPYLFLIFILPIMLSWTYKVFFKAKRA